MKSRDSLNQFHNFNLIVSYNKLFDYKNMKRESEQPNKLSDEILFNMDETLNIVGKKRYEFLDNFPPLSDKEIKEKNALVENIRKISKEFLNNKYTFNEI